MKTSLATILLLLLLFSCQTEKKTDTEIHTEILTLDTHIDIALKFVRDSTYKFSERHTYLQDETRTDLPRMHDGGLDAAIFAVWTPQKDRTQLGNSEAKIKALKIIATIEKNIAETNNAIIAKSTNEFYKIITQNKTAILMGMENGYPIGNNIAEVQNFYNRGIRYITLCHTLDNDICDSSTDETEDEGLSNFGIEVIKEMNRLGIIVDVSHISDSAFYQVMRVTKTPVIASHSNARALCSHPRNMTDNMIKLLAKNGGVISINFYEDYLLDMRIDTVLTSKQIASFNKKWAHLKTTKNGKKEYDRLLFATKHKPPIPPEVTLNDVINHIDYVVKLVGINHVGIGSDFDGGGGITGLEDVSKMGNITSELLKRGYSQRDIQKIWSGNFLRVFKEVEDYASTKDEI